MNAKTLDYVKYQNIIFAIYQFSFFQRTMFTAKALGTAALLTATVNIPAAAFSQRISTVLRFPQDLDIARAQRTYVATILEMAALLECVLLQVLARD